MQSDLDMNFFLPAIYISTLRVSVHSSDLDYVATVFVPSFLGCFKTLDILLHDCSLFFFRGSLVQFPFILIYTQLVTDIVLLQYGHKYCVFLFLNNDKYLLVIFCVSLLYAH